MKSEKLKMVIAIGGIEELLLHWRRNASAQGAYR